jgi:hypothetical protein
MSFSSEKSTPTREQLELAAKAAVFLCAVEIGKSLANGKAM